VEAQRTRHQLNDGQLNDAHVEVVHGENMDNSAIHKPTLSAHVGEEEKGHFLFPQTGTALPVRFTGKKAAGSQGPEAPGAMVLNLWYLGSFVKILAPGLLTYRFVFSWLEQTPEQRNF
jgi:hypothetical protein